MNFEWRYIGRLAGRIAIALGAALFAGVSSAAGTPPAADGVAATAPMDVFPGSGQRLVIRFRSEAKVGPGGVLSPELKADLERTIGGSLRVEGVTAGGDSILVLGESLGTDDVKRALNALRMRADVLRADLERNATTRLASKRLRLKAPAAPDDAAVVRQFIITFTDPGTRERASRNEPLGGDALALVQAAAGVPVEVVRPTVGGAWIVALPAPISRSAAQALAQRIAGAPGIRHVTPDFPVRSHYQPNDPYYQQGYLWNLDDPENGDYYGIDAARAWNITQGSPSIVVAVVDTGIILHPDLVDRLVPGYDFITSQVRARDGDGRDANPLDWGDWAAAGDCGAGEAAEESSWHGSHVAGTIAATGDNGRGIVGVAWRTSIQPVRALGRCGGNWTDILEAMHWAAGLPVPGVPNNPTPARVINMSLGGPGLCDDQTQALVDQVLARGTFIAVSAGNDSANADDYSPAGCYGVSTVAATDPYGDLASYSNYSYYIDIAAPGGDKSRYTRYDGIVSTVDNSGGSPSGTYVYDWYQGTSMASPHVAGVAALMLAVDPNLTPAQIKAIQAETSSYFAPSSACRTDEDCGAGIVNAYYALRETLRIASLAITPVIEFYNPQLDHYFIASSAQADVGALDSGAIPGWGRTGMSFAAYASEVEGLSSVCRFYIPPFRGNSHFYTASDKECNAIYNAARDPADPAYRTYSGFVYETSAAFYIGVPVGGSCPPSQIAVYRLWNNRADSNHRYTTSIELRDAMIARGYVNEGIVMCAQR